jgi:5-formyltetrahydrofolate cyclo-ligase
VTPDPAIAAAKAALRAQFRAARLALSDADYAAASGEICARLAAQPEIRDARVVSVYWPLVPRREVDTRPLIAALRQRGATVVLPVTEPGRARPTMHHVAFTGEEALRATSWGLLEPAGPPFPAGAIEAVVVPALGAGRNGHRIGHGAGYYDAFLATCAAPALAAVFDACLVDHVPTEPHDVPLTAIITETASVRPGA